MEGSTRSWITKDGRKHWKVTVYIGRDPTTGRERRRSRNFSEKSEADKWKRDMCGKVERREAVVSPKISLHDFIEVWKVRRPLDVSEQTFLTNYGPIFRRHFVPELGHHQLRHLSAPIIVGYLRSRVETKKLSPATLVKHYLLLHRLLKSAVSWKYLGVNPCDEVAKEDRPKRGKPKISVPWTEEDVRLFLATAGRVSDYAALWTFLVYSGARLGEALAATWPNLHGNILHIEQTYDYRLPPEIRFHPPKSENAIRDIALSPIVLDTLDRVRRQREEWKALYPADYTGELIFADQHGHPLNADHLRWDFARIVRAASVPRIRVHDCRHLHATLMLDSGESLLVVSQRLGHADRSTTLKFYGHVMKGADARAAMHLEERLSGKPESVGGGDGR